MINQLINPLLKLVILASILILALTVNYLEAAWSQPSASPTGGNVALPVNTSSVTQDKAGVLTVGALGTFGLATVQGGVRSSSYCDVNGNNCSSASEIRNAVINSGSFNAGDYLDTSNTDQTKSGDLRVGGLVIGDRELHFDNGGSGGDYMRWVTADGLYGYENGTQRWRLKSNGDVNANRYCDENGNNCIDPAGLTMECVSGIHREGGTTGIQTSSLGNNYSFSDVFVASNRNAGTQPEIRCRGEWTMTGCGAGTTSGTSDNDETMDGRNMCVGDQAGDQNNISARCCRIVIQ